MQEREMAMATSLYRTDFPAWAYQQAALLKDRKFDQVDWDDLIEEIEDMGNRHHDKLYSHAVILLQHLLKWQFQSERQGNSWRSTIVNNRAEIPHLLKRYPSLKSDLNDAQWFDEVWQDATRRAANETGLKNTFPQQPIWTVEQILDENFFPSAK
ncbi:MAG: DUF29 domain-containing protein [Neisseriaceae bacterium]|nr:DUF29 domain-containing protein [Neisseriaceae bacterium]